MGADEYMNVRRLETSWLPSSSAMSRWIMVGTM